MNILKTILDKMKLKELLAIAFIASVFLTFMPSSLAQKMQIELFRTTYQSHISICIIVVGAYYLINAISWTMKYAHRKMHNLDKSAIKYISNTMSQDEKEFLIDYFYDNDKCLFRVSANVDMTNGIIAPLESKGVIYRATEISRSIEFAYNLRPSVLNFLNDNLEKGKIKIDTERYEWNV